MAVPCYPPFVCECVCLCLIQMQCVLRFARKEIKEFDSYMCLHQPWMLRNRRFAVCCRSVYALIALRLSPCLLVFSLGATSACSCMLILAMLRNLIRVKVSFSLRLLAMLLIMQHSECAWWGTDDRSRSVYTINGITMGSELLPIKSPLKTILQR